MHTLDLHQSSGRFRYHHIIRQAEDLLERVCQEGESIRVALFRLVQVSKKSFTRDDYSPCLGDPYQWIPTVDGYRGDNVRRKDDLSDLIRLEIDHNGNGHLFCGRAAEFMEIGEKKEFLFFPKLVAGNVAQFLYLFGYLYDQAEYNGFVDLGVAVTGLKGCVPFTRRRRVYNMTPYDHDEYRRTVRCSAHELLNDTQAIASELVMPLIRAIMLEQINPLLPNKLS